MILIEEILRIKNLISENELGYKISHSGILDEGHGIEIKIYDHDSEIGKISILDFDLAKKLDVVLSKLTKEMNEKGIPLDFTKKNTVFSHTLEVDKKHRGKGYGKKLMNEIESLAKNLGYNYIVGVIDNDNHKSRGMHEKLNYQKRHSDKYRDLYFKKLN